MSSSSSSTTGVVGKPEPRGGRCTGACCRAFHLQYSPEQLKAWEVGEDDAGTIARMVRFVRVVEPGQLLPVGIPLPQGCPPQYVYACTNLLPNGDCAIYATRPVMCRDFPYGQPCPYPGCEWSDGRAGAHGHRRAGRFGPDELADYEPIPGAVSNRRDVFRKKEKANDEGNAHLSVRAGAPDAGRAGACGGGAAFAAVDRRVGDDHHVDAADDHAAGAAPGVAGFVRPMGQGEGRDPA